MKIAYLEKPVNIHELRKTYNDSVEFITDTGSYPMVKAIAYDGQLHKAIDGKLQSKDMKKKVDRLLELYKRTLYRSWDSHINEILNKTAIEKADENKSSEEKKKIIAGILAGLGISLASDALDFYRQAYLLGKERGISISGDDFKAGISEEVENKLNDLSDENRAYLRGFMQALNEKLGNVVDEDYKNKQVEEEKLKEAAATSEARLNLYIPAILSAFALGMVDGISEADEQKEPDEETVSGIIWITNHDDAVCEGCAENDGKFFTLDEFADEYQNNECLTNCRCAETSEPTTAPREHFARSARIKDIAKRHQRTIACDLDGVLAEYDHWRGIHNFGNPIKKNIKALEKEKANGSKIIIFTARINTQENPEYTKEQLVAPIKNWLDKNNIPYDEVWDEVGKPIADEYWDDRAVKKFEKGGPGSGCVGPTCGRPRVDIKEIRPAIRINGITHVGNKGELHDDIFSRLSEKEQNSYYPETGFVDKDGKWLSRKELSNIASTNTSEGLRELQESARKFDEFLDLKKGGAGSGCQGPNCGRPKTTSSELKLKTKYPDAFTFNEKDPINTKVNSDGKPVDKFSISPDNEFIPNFRDERHAQEIQGDWQSFDQHVRTIQDPQRKLAIMRFGGADQETLSDALNGNKAAMDRVLDRQSALAHKLYGPHKGWKVILASGGTKAHDFNMLPERLDSSDEIPKNADSLVDSKFVYRT